MCTDSGLSPCPPLGFGVLGCADIGWRRMLPAIAAHPSARLVACASRSPHKAKRFSDHFGGTPCSSYEALLEHPGVEAVYVPLPPSMHYTWAERAIRAGKHVLCEKPLTTNACQTEELLRLSDRYGVALVENYAFEHHAMHARVEELLAEGVLGELRHFESAFTVPRRSDGDIRLRSDLGGGALLDAGGYPLRAALHFLGALDIVGVVSQQGQGVDISGTVLARSSSGISATLTYGLDHHYRADYSMHGSRGRLSLNRVFTAPPTFLPTLHLRIGDEERAIPLVADDQLGRLLSAFIAAAHGRRDPALEDTQLLHARLIDEIGAKRRTSETGMCNSR